MNDKECIDRIRTGCFCGKYGFDMQILVDAIGCAGEMMRDGRLILLEPLCQWLAGYAAPPNYALDEVRDDSIDPESLVYTANDRAKAWAFHFRELMKSGLMDTEGEDARP